MIVCTHCGFTNEDGARFCGGCQEYLDWTGRVVEEEGVDDEAEAPSDSVPVERKGVVERVVDRLTGHEDGDEASDEGVEAGEVSTPTEPVVSEPTPEDSAAALEEETVERAERAAREAEQAQREAEAHVSEQTEVTQRARQSAEAAEVARREAEEQARSEAEAAARAREKLEAARLARQEAEEQLRRETEAAQQARAATEEQRGDQAQLAEESRRAQEELQRAREETEARLQEERSAAERAQAELEAAEAARVASEERARVEAEAAEAAAREAEEAERIRLAAEAKAKEEAAAAERARRAAALVARPQPRKPAPDTAAREPNAPRPTKPRKAEEASGSENRPPQPVKPAAQRIRPAARDQKGPTRRLRPGDLICGQCGEGNNPARNFCHRCGHPLAEAEVVRRPWWRRWIPHRKPRVYAAGERPSRVGASTGSGGGGAGGIKDKGRGALKQARGLRRLVSGGVGKVTRVMMLVAFGAAAVGLTVNPSLRSSVTDRAGSVVDWIRGTIAPRYEPVTPVSVDASSELSDHPAESAIDNTSNRWWAEGASGDGVGERLVIRFAEPVDIAVVGVTPGAADPEQFVAEPRPRLLHLVFDNGTTTDLRIADEHEFQTFDVKGAEGVTSVEVQVLEVWQGQTGSDMAITSIEFRTRA